MVFQTFTALEYINIAIANAYGLDKETWDFRINWAKNLLTTCEPQNLDIVIEEAEEPLLMTKAIHAYNDAMDGIPTGFIMGLDATASGQQIMACLSGCFNTAKHVNLVDTGKREDVYQMMADVMGMGLTKKEIKKPLMTYFYGSEAQPKMVFGENTPELVKFYDVLNQELLGAVEVMDVLQSLWQPFALDHTFTLPDGHVAKIKVMQPVEKKIELDELLNGNGNKSTFTFRTYQNIGTESGISIAANVTHGIDGYVVREMVRRAVIQNFQILTIHDSFWCSPIHMNKLRKNYNDILAEIADSNLLQDIASEILGYPVTIEKTSTNLSKYIREANYALS